MSGPITGHGRPFRTPGEAPDTSVGYTVGSPPLLPDFDNASAFTSAGSFVLDTIELGMTHETGANELDIFFASDASGVPGTVLETFHLSNAVPGPLEPPSPIMVTSLLHPLLTSGNQYWVFASAPATGSWLVWNLNNTGDIGPTADRIDGGAWVLVEDDLRGAMRINGTAVAAIPEPSTYALMLAGLGLVVFAAKRAKRNRAAA